MKVFELKQKRANLAKEARQLLETAVKENRDNTPEEQAKLDGHMESIRGLDSKITTMQRVEEIESLDVTPEDRSREHNAGLPDLDGKQPYSLLRAVRCILGYDKGGIESEVSQEIAKRSGKQPQGIFVPWNLATSRQVRGNLESRAVTTTTGIGSIAAILGTELIDLLRNRMVLNAMGAQVLTDMTGGTFSLPRQNAAGTAYWVAEGSAPTASNLTINQVTWTPKTVGAYQDVSRKFVLQTNQDAEALVRADLAKILAIELDRVGLNGSGSGAQPLGILQDGNITVEAIGTNGGAMTWAALLAMEADVATNNADFGSLGYITSPKGRKALKKTPKIGTTFPVFQWENDQVGAINGAPLGMVNGYRAAATTQIPSNLTKGSGTGLTAVIFGNFASATYAFWSGLDLLVDPYTGSSTGAIRIVALQDADIQYRYETAFANCVDLDPAA